MKIIKNIFSFLQLFSFNERRMKNLENQLRFDQGGNLSYSPHELIKQTSGKCIHIDPETREAYFAPHFFQSLQPVRLKTKIDTSPGAVNFSYNMLVKPKICTRCRKVEIE